MIIEPNNGTDPTIVVQPSVIYDKSAYLAVAGESAHLNNQEVIKLILGLAETIHQRVEFIDSPTPLSALDRLTTIAAAAQAELDEVDVEINELFHIVKEAIDGSHERQP